MNLQKIPQGHVVVGVSGGVDSVALAHMLWKQGVTLTVAHFNHGLRGAESDADERLVKDLAQAWGVPFYAQKAVRPTRGNVEDELRKQRYAFLESVRVRVGAEAIAVAHHMDDQAETVLMHLRRGAGLRGLCGMHSLNKKIVRPLLGVRKSDLSAYARKHRLPSRHDASNDDTGLERNFIRHRVIPALERESKSIVEDLAHLSLAAQAMLKKLQNEVRGWLKEHALGGAFERAAFLKLEPAMREEVLITLMGATDLYQGALWAALRLIERGKTGTRGVLKQKVIRLEYGRVVVSDAAVGAEAAPLKPITVGSTPVRWGRWTIACDAPVRVRVRAWQPGDRFTPTGMRGSKKLQDFFTDAKIPRSERLQIPVVTDDTGQILAVGNLRLSRHAEPIAGRLRVDRV